MTTKEDGRIRVDRRTTIKWLAAAMAAAQTGCSSDDRFLGDEIPPRPGKLLGTATAPDGVGYGTDPDLGKPVVPWSRTMTDAQLATTAALCDMILPADDRSPAASAVGVPDFIDEWVSAPYAAQQQDRALILPGLEWLEQESLNRFGTGFATAEERGRAGLLDPLAGPRKAPDALAERARFFERFRYLTVGAFYTTEAGITDVGYIGNVAIGGAYPGPSEAAMRHLSGVLERLGLGPP